MEYRPVCDANSGNLAIQLKALNDSAATGVIDALLKAAVLNPCVYRVLALSPGPDPWP
jgi:hypothetical protein